MFGDLSIPHIGLAILIIGTIALTSVLTRKLTISAALLGGLLALIIFCSAGYAGLGLLGSFFVIGILATSWKIEKKASLKLHENNFGRRKAGQVFANAGVAGILGVTSLILPDYSQVINIMIAATFAASTSDTVSSELGNVYGSRFYNILSFKRDEKGLDGVISLEGTLLGVAGALVIAVVYGIGFKTTSDLWLIVTAGVLGNFADSLIGATLERKNLFSNDTVNFLNNVLAAAFVLLVKV